jgi:membrane protein implicated in regulation of membrane protease activity
MLGVYLFTAVLGVGLLLMSLLGAGDGGDGTELEFDGDVDMDLDLDAELEAGDGPGIAGDLILGLFKPRNLTFLLAAFGSTGALLTWAGKPAGLVLALAIGMGTAAWFTTHAVFTLLHRTDSGVDALDDHDLEGAIGRVTLPITPDGRGQVTLVAAGRQTYLTARLEPGVARALPVGTEVLIRRTDGGVAEVMPTDTLDLPPSTT